MSHFNEYSGNKQEIINSDNKFNTFPSALITHTTVKGVSPIIIKSGKGPFLYDIDGKRYLDFELQGGAVRLGYGNKEIIEAMENFLEEAQLIGFKYINIPRVKLEELLAEITPKNLTRSWFGTNGTDANFLSIKVARQYTGKYELIGNPTYNVVKENASGITNVPYPRCHRCPYGLTYPECGMVCLKAVEKTVEILGNRVAGILTDPMPSGPEGISPPPKEYLPALRRICDNHNLVLVFDDIETSFGMSGKMFSFEHYDVVPDMLCLGKGITSGYAPLSALMVTDNIVEQVKKGTSKSRDYFPQNYVGEFHTYSGYPLGCVAALANINIIRREKLCDNASKMGEYIQNALEDIFEDSEMTGVIHGRGLYIHVDICKNEKGKEKDLEMTDCIAKKCVENGLLIAGENGVIRLKAPININKEHADLAIQILSDAVEEAEKEKV